jgi:hypothetical protein
LHPGFYLGSTLGLSRHVFPARTGHIGWPSNQGDDMRKRAHRYFVPAAAATVCALLVGAAAGARTANVCASVGATPAVAAKALGSGARSSADVVAGSQACVLTSKAAGGPSVTIVMMGGKLDNRVTSNMYQGQVTSEGLTGLGKGAVFLSTSDHSFQHLWFQAGSQTVKVTSDGSPHVAPAKLVAVARAVYAHLS